MKVIKRLTAILSLFLLTSCGVNWQVATLNHDPIYDDENYIVVAGGVVVDTLSAFQFRNKLRTDFGFRFDFARYALSQPRSFDWNNRVLGIGIEIKCGMTGYGDTMDGIHGVHLIGGHHLDTIDGDITYTMVGITTDGDIMDTTVTDGITMGGIIMVKIIGTEDEVEPMYRTLVVEEVVLCLYKIE